MELKRSLINKVIDESIIFFRKRNFHLPPFAYWSADEWKRKGSEYDEIRVAHLGWDITDFGLGNFSKFGRIIFTLRNGNGGNPLYRKPYAQKVMRLLENQKSPTHYHRSKTEDIINMGDGIVCIRLWPLGPHGSLGKTDVKISLDGMKKIIRSGGLISLHFGESVCLKPGTFHQFWAKEGNGPTISMEVSSVNDDTSDNFWLEHAERFPKITEDEPRRYFLCNEYEPAGKIRSKK